MGITVAVFACFLAVPVIIVLHRLVPRLADLLAVALPLGLTVYFSLLVPDLHAEGARRVAFAWLPALDIDFRLSVDGLSLLFALLVTGIGVPIFLYSGAYFHADPQRGRFYALMFLFMGSMLGLVLADHLILLSVFWELTTLSSFLLIGFHREDPEARSAALQALLVTNAGGLAMLAGFLLFGGATGTFVLSALPAAGPDLRAHPWYPAILALVLTGAFTKSAQFPFHFWLPRAMAAPSPVSAYLHSAAMVNAGVYLLARLHPVLGGSIAWTAPLTLVGLVTMFAGGWMAILQDDMKAVLAYSTVSVLGMLVLLLGMGSRAAVKAMLAYLVGHALYKAALFLAGGAASHETGTRDLRRLSGLGRAMPLVALAAALPAAAKAGVPPTFSTIGKELIYKAGLRLEPGSLLLPALLVGANMFLVAVAWLTGVRPYLGRRLAPRRPGQVKAALWLAPLMLGLANLGLGILPNPLAGDLLAPAAEGVAGRGMTVHLAVWHGLVPPFFMSCITWTGGVLVIWQRPALRRLATRLARVGRWGPARVYELVLVGLLRLGRSHTGIIQNGYQRYYLMIIIGAAAVLIWSRLLTGGGMELEVGSVPFYEAGVALIIPAAAFMALLCRTAMASVLALGLVGYGVAMIYVLYGAPDLAITQFVIETVTVILFALIVYQLPSFAMLSSRRARLRDAALALLFGSVMTALVLKANAMRLGERISDFYLARSVPAAHGHNVVNVILVDFRAFDTLGEITVLTTAAVGVYALLKFRQERRRSSR